MSTHHNLGEMPLLPPPGLESRAATAENPTGARGGGGHTGGGRKGRPCIAPLAAGETAVLADISGPGVIRHLWITFPPGNPMHERNLIVRIYWDDQPHASVECPIGDFFGMPHGKRVPLNSALICVPEGRGYSSFIPMPFRRRCQLTIENDSETDVAQLFYQVDYTVGDVISAETACLHATFRRENPTKPGDDYVVVDRIEGRGRFLGCVVGLRTLDRFWWGEGEFKFFLDGDLEHPTICGTGSEDYACTAYGMGPHQTPYHGCALYDAKSDDDLGTLLSYYRWHVLDPIYFHQDLRVTVQQIGGAFVARAREEIKSGRMRVPHPLQPGQEFTLFERADDYCSTAFWYQSLPSRPLAVLPDRTARSADLT